tara:strand:+ start:40 stop:1224 length:1185 start_codon:yes stop_codon:yes gene_type:complete
MKTIKLLIFLLALSSCNKYLGTVDPDYVPTNETTKVFANIKNDDYVTEVKFGNVIYPKLINPSPSLSEFKIDKITNIDKNTVINFINDRIIFSKDKKIYLIDNSDSNKYEYELNLNKDEKVLYIFEYEKESFILTNKTKLFMLTSQNVEEVVDHGVYTNITPIHLNNTLIILSVFGEIFEINLDDKSISKKGSINFNPGISIKSNLFEDSANFYYLFNTGTLVTLSKNNYEYLNNYILEDLNILTSLDSFNELLDTPFSYNESMYFLDRSGKIAVYNQFTSDILWELDINDTISSYIFTEDGYLILITFEKILILSNKGNVIYSYDHNKKLPLSIFKTQENIYFVSEEGISMLNMVDNIVESFYENKFTSNLDIYFFEQQIFLKDEKSLFKLSE